MCRRLVWFGENLVARNLVVRSMVARNMVVRAWRVAGCVATMLLCDPSWAFEHRHGVGAGYHSAHISAREKESFHFRSFPLSYAGRYGGDIGAELRVASLFPLRARQGVLTFSPRAEYDRAQQFDALLAPNVRFSRLFAREIDSGFGAHFHYARLRSTEYVEWSSAALGLGASVAARTPLSQEFWAGHGELSVLGLLAYDFIDLSRGGHMTGGVVAQVLVTVGYAMGTHQ